MSTISEAGAYINFGLFPGVYRTQLSHEETMGQSTEKYELCVLKRFCKYVHNIVP
jgi:hypothetical protein